MNTVKKDGELLLPALMSLTNVVPIAVPSVEYSSIPFIPSSAMKYNLFIKTVKKEGELLAEPALISLTKTVPTAEPSLFQSSVPCVVPLFAEKNKILLQTFKFVGVLLKTPE